MSSIEEQLRRDIAAVTQGVIVTEQNLREARSNIEEHLEIGQQGGRRRGLALLAAAAVVVPIVGALAFQAMNDGDTSGAPTAPPTEPSAPYANFLIGGDPTADLLNGVWRVDDGVMLVQFRLDGTVQFNDEGGLFTKPATTGRYAIDGDRITIRTTRSGTDGAACDGTELVVRASIPGPGLVALVNPETSNRPCLVVRPYERWTLERILPTASDYAEFMPPDDEYAPVTRPALLYGDWVAATGDHMIEFRPGGYVVAGGAGEILDEGTWRLVDQELELVSGPQSPSCGTGDRLVLRGLTHGDASPSEFIRGTIGTDECRGPWAKTDWLLLPNQRSN